nr:hypothetical protein [Bacteroidota bacterium]
MQRSDETFVPVMVWDPYTATTVNMAPVLYVINEYFGGFDHAAVRITEFIEDIISNHSNLVSENPDKFHDFMFDLKMLRRSFTATKTGQQPQC